MAGQPACASIRATSAARTVSRPWWTRPARRASPSASGSTAAASRRISWKSSATPPRRFYHTKISLKASDVIRTVQAYRLLAKQVDYPLHLGITEAGTPWGATIRSSIGMGILLAEGIGDTIRVSLTGEGSEECRIGHEMLRALGLRSGGFHMVSCPGCGRTQIDLKRVAQEIEQGLTEINHEHITYAVMGCVVNGPGEAREADLGVAGGVGEGRIYRKGVLIRTVREEDLVSAFLEEARKLKVEYARKG